DPKQGRNRVKIDQLIVETPRLPRFTPKERTDIGIKTDPPAMDSIDEPPSEPARPDPPTEPRVALLKERNIFRLYVPPPTNFVVIDNQDRLNVAVTLKSFW